MRAILMCRTPALLAKFHPIRAFLLFLLGFAIGCGGSQPPLESPEAAHIGKVAELVSEFKTANKGNNPKTIDDLKNWAVNAGKGDDKDFVSTRDHEPYVIEHQAMSRGRGGITSAPMASQGPVIIHEATGKNGRKFVVRGVIPQASEMSDEGLQYLTHGPTGMKTK